MGLNARTYVILLTVILTGCDDNESFLSGRNYSHSYFDSYEECLAHQSPDFFINCSQELWFYEDGKMEIMFSDIVYSGKYAISLNKIHLSLEYALESPKKITFTVISHDLIKRDDDGTLWKLND